MRGSGPCDCEPGVFCVTCLQHSLSPGQRGCGHISSQTHTQVPHTHTHSRAHFDLWQDGRQREGPGPLSLDFTDCRSGWGPGRVEGRGV